MNDDLLQQALRGAQSPAASAAAIAPQESVLVIGGGGVLGSALVAEALVAGRFSHVRAAVKQAMKSAMRGFEPWPAALLQAPAAAVPAATAFIVFERQRRGHGRDDAFMWPQPDDLQDIAVALRRLGVRRLLVVVPHAPALLPGALKAGLATLDETAVAALGFEHLVFIRAAQEGERGAGHLRWPDRFARWWLAQLRWMVPPSEQPVRAVTLALLAVQLARALPLAPLGTRVVPPELLSRAAASKHPESMLADWLHRRALPDAQR